MNYFRTLNIAITKLLLLKETTSYVINYKINVKAYNNKLNKYKVCLVQKPQNRYTLDQCIHLLLLNMLIFKRIDKIYILTIKITKFNRVNSIH